MRLRYVLLLVFDFDYIWNPWLSLPQTHCTWDRIFTVTEIIHFYSLRQNDKSTSRNTCICFCVHLEPCSVMTVGCDFLVFSFLLKYVSRLKPVIAWILFPVFIKRDSFGCLSSQIIFTSPCSLAVGSNRVFS